MEKKSGLKTFANCWKWSHTSFFRFLHIGTQNASQMNGQIRSGIFIIDLTHPLTIVLDYLSVSVSPLPCFDTVLVFACLWCGGIHSPFKRIEPKSCKTRIMIAWVPRLLVRSQTIYNHPGASLVDLLVLLHVSFLFVYCSHSEEHFIGMMKIQKDYHQLTYNCY